MKKKVPTMKSKPKMNATVNKNDLVKKSSPKKKVVKKIAK